MAVIPSGTRHLSGGRRILGAGRTACTVCDADVRTVMEHPGRRQTRLLVGIHGPKTDRCPGSRKPGKGWVAGCHLLPWSEMSDHDKGQALMFAHKCWWEQSFAYARENYPPEYTDPRLTDLADVEPAGRYTARHAAAVLFTLGTPQESVPNFWASTSTLFDRKPAMVREPSIDMARRILGTEEVERLMTLAGPKFRSEVSG